MAVERFCRFCATPLTHSVVNLGVSPVSNAFVREEDLPRPEKFYPLQAFVCSKCFLVQIDDVESPEHHFNANYAYFSSYSKSFVKHAERYCETMRFEHGISKGHQVIEIASNDGYLLQHFLKHGIVVQGIDPSANVARVAEEKGIRTLVQFFGQKLAHNLKAQGMMADLLIGNNVVAHVPDINDFIGGMKTVLKPGGIITLEFPHLLRLLEDVQFDTIYHEHFSYLSLATVMRILEKHELKVFKVSKIPTHGGSLRIFACHAANEKAVDPSVAALLGEEAAAGLEDLSTYEAFRNRILDTKMALLSFLIRARSQGKKVVGYGAPAKGNTLLNFCGIRTDFVEYTVDVSNYKQGLYLPGTRIPIQHPNKILETKPDFVLILPWNLKDEIMDQMAVIHTWGAKFVVPIPHLQVLP